MCLSFAPCLHLQVLSGLKHRGQFRRVSPVDALGSGGHAAMAFGQCRSERKHTFEFKSVGVTNVRMRFRTMP